VKYIHNNWAGGADEDRTAAFVRWLHCFIGSTSRMYGKNSGLCPYLDFEIEGEGTDRTM
jgi:hypothetical protein